MILFPAIDLKDGQCAAAEARRMATGRSTMTISSPGQNLRSQGFGGCMSSTSAAPSRARASTARRRRHSRQRRTRCSGGGIHPGTDWLDRGLAVSSSVRWRCAIPTWSGRPARRSGQDRRRHRRQGRQGRSRGWSRGLQPQRHQRQGNWGTGVAAIIYTDIDRDGVLTGINWDATIDLADAVSIPVIASGGLASIADIVRMTMPDARKLEGAISRRALYAGRIDAAEALAVLQGKAMETRS